MTDFYLWLCDNSTLAWHVAGASVFVALLARLWWLEVNRDSWKALARETAYLDQQLADVTNGIARLTAQLQRRQEAEHGRGAAGAARRLGS